VIRQAGAAVLLLVLTLSLQCVGVAALITWLKGVVANDIHDLRLVHAAELVMETTLAIIFLHGLVILLWAGCYRWLCFPSLESAFYFSASSYATVGYGDVVLPSKWRLLGPLESMIGVLMCGISVSLLFALVTRLVDGEARSRAAKAG